MELRNRSAVPQVVVNQPNPQVNPPNPPQPNPQVNPQPNPQPNPPQPNPPTPPTPPPRPRLTPPPSPQPIDNLIFLFMNELNQIHLLSTKSSCLVLSQ